MFPACVLQSEPFNGQGSLPSGGAGGYNAFTQAAVSGVGHTHTQLSNNTQKCTHEDGLFLFNGILWRFEVLNTRHCCHFSARSGWSDAWVSKFTDGRESNASNDTWDIHTSIPVSRTGHKTPVPSTRYQTQHQQPAALDRWDCKHTSGSTLYYKTRYLKCVYIQSSPVNSFLKCHVNKNCVL